MATKRQKSIAENLSALCDREFTGLEIAMIENTRKTELDDRRKKGINLKSNSTAGKLLINTRMAEMVNGTLNPKIPMTAEHIRQYKHVWADEYTERTGKCAWGFKDVRKKFGYDPFTNIAGE